MAKSLQQAEKSKLTADIRIVVAGGGTGGHLYPGLALADKFREMLPSVHVVFVGTDRGLEARVVPEQGYELLVLPIRGLLRKLTWQNVLVPFRLAYSVLKCISFFRRFRPQIVIGTGGFASGPALLAAGMLKIPRAVQEQNNYPGLVNRKLGNAVDAVFLTFEASKRYFTAQKNVFVYGNPIRGSLFNTNKNDGYSFFNLDKSKKTVLVFGGSQGAKKLNETILSMLPGLQALPDVQVIWAVGTTWYEQISQAADTAAENIRIVPYIEEMGKAYAIADLAVCRAGASTISELVTCGIPAIYVPFPFATADHQTANAQAVVHAGGGVLVHEKELTADLIFEHIRQLVTDEERLVSMSAAAKKLSMHNAAELIARDCLKLIDKEGSP